MATASDWLDTHFTFDLRSSSELLGQCSRSAVSGMIVLRARERTTHFLRRLSS